MRGGILVGLATLAAVGVVQVASWVERGNALPVRTVAVRGLDLAQAAGSIPKDRADEIRAYANIKTGEPLFAVDVDAVAKRVMEHPFVSSANVRRVPPDGIEIAVSLRSPAAAVACDGDVYLVDDKGQVMKSARAGDGLDLALVTGVSKDDVASGAAEATLASAVALLGAHKAAGAPGGAASEVHDVSGVGLELVLDDGSRVLVGDEAREFGAKMLRLDSIERGLKAGGRSASFIDLDDDRRPERAAVRLRPVAEMSPAGGKKKIPRERG
jgi:cell division protein FtsQ